MKQIEMALGIVPENTSDEFSTRLSHLNMGIIRVLLQIYYCSITELLQFYYRSITELLHANRKLKNICFEEFFCYSDKPCSLQCYK